MLNEHMAESCTWFITGLTTRQVDSHTSVSCNSASFFTLTLLISNFPSFPDQLEDDGGKEEIENPPPGEGEEALVWASLPANNSV